MAVGVAEAAVKDVRWDDNVTGATVVTKQRACAAIS